MNDFIDLKGKVAAITGGSGMIGQALVKGLCSARCECDDPRC